MKSCDATQTQLLIVTCLWAPRSKKPLSQAGARTEGRRSRTWGLGGAHDAWKFGWEAENASREGSLSKFIRELMQSPTRSLGA
ncbi:hypothetical protein LPU83_pLPU83d_1664 (plasmid) [Rhizobium favelukesii]|uniref:Uncharacterized protein n=1 Tax=Rhizobium favelukesii TaxID=348824 RepID=W6RQP6_9HYPH|nr:hypothetical protein LPU83_pLPU83d_1664 [Rhizobium favelukesii]